MLNLVLFGPPGAGKGTQSEKIIASYGLTHLSTGDLFRKHLGEGTALGNLAKGFMDKGHLVPDEVVIQMVEDKIATTKDSKGYIFDGFPRTTAQAEALDKLLESHHTKIHAMISLEVEKEELIKRLLSRGAVSGRADDANTDIIENRINEYNNKTYPLKAYYQKQDKLRSVHGIGSVDEIFSNICGVIDELS